MVTLSAHKLRRKFPRCRKALLVASLRGACPVKIYSTTWGGGNGTAHLGIVSKMKSYVSTGHTPQ
jgi:hypothetical protein